VEAWEVHNLLEWISPCFQQGEEEGYKHDKSFIPVQGRKKK
jgi:hypothetical protein